MDAFTLSQQDQKNMNVPCKNSIRLSSNWYNKKFTIGPSIQQVTQKSTTWLGQYYALFVPSSSLGTPL